MYPLIGLALVGLVMLGGEKRQRMGLPYRVSKFRALVGRSAVRACAVFPWLSSQVDEAIERAWESGLRLSDDLVTYALMEVYPVTPEGEEFSWPSVPGDCVQIKALEERTHYRAKLIAAAQNDIAADESWYGSGGR